jgi:NitT/TauT family transport system substrate-binding protein
MRLQFLTCNMFFCLLALLCNPLASAAAQKPSFKVCWSPYAGWLAWDYAKQEQIMDKWAEQYGIAIEIEKVPDSLSAIGQYSAGTFDACAMSNVDALSIAATSGIDSTALIIGDFSAGADGLVLRGFAKGLGDLKGKTILVTASPAARYLLNRALQVAHISPGEVKIQTVLEQDLLRSFIDGQGDALISRNPELAAIKRQVEVSQVFSSKFIAGEIIDLMLVNSATLAAHPELGKALTGAWYEVQQLLAASSPEGRLARAKMADSAGTSPADFEVQLKSIRSFYIPRSALAFADSKKMPELMQRVAEFADSQQLTASPKNLLSQLGISFSQRRVLGNPEHIMLRFDPTYMQLLADQRTTAKPMRSLNQHLNQVTMLPTRGTPQ